MLSAAPPLFSSSKKSSTLLRELRVLYRRVCVLRVSGKTEEADELLSGKFAALLTRAREADEVSMSELDAIFASEEERVDAAHALAEMLLPLLTTAIDASIAQHARSFSPSRSAAAPTRTETEPHSGSAAEQVPPSENNHTGPMLPGIADFIDEMLTQDRAPSEGRSIRRPA